MVHRSTCALMVVFALACSRKAERAGGEAGSAAGSGSAIAARDAGAPDGATEAERTQAEARQLVHDWLAAQNTGAFDAYAALYATRFEGVRRSGKRVARLDRARWLRERARMFKAKMEVEATDLEIRATRATALVRFTQTWASGTYKDVGPKVLMLVREGGALRISREELLASEIETGPPVARDQLAFVARLDATRVAALLGRGDDAWGRGAPRQVDGDDIPTMITLERDLDPAKLPPELARWRGEAVTVYAIDGTTCAGTVAGLVLVQRYLPYHLELRVEWEGLSGDDIARAVWPRSAPDIAAVVTVDEACGAVTFARVARLPAPVMWAREAADADLEARALKAFRALPAYKELQRVFREPIPDLPAHTGRWEEYEGATPEVAVFRSPATPARTFVAVSGRAGPGCNDFEGALTAIWEVTGASLTPIAESSEAPDLVLDLDADGEPEVIYETRSHELSRSLMSGRALDVARAWDTVNNGDCGC